MNLSKIFDNNPIMWYHLTAQARLRGLPKQVTLFLAIAFILCYLMVIYFCVSMKVDVLIISYGGLVLFTMITPLFCFNLLSAEYEKKTMESLILTKLKAVEIVGYKFLSRYVLFLTIFILLALLIIVSYYYNLLNPSDNRYWTNMFGSNPDYLGFIVYRSLFLILSWSTFVMMLSLWSSHRTKSSVTSSGLSYGIILFLLAILPLLQSIIITPFIDKTGMAYYFNDMLYRINPYVILYDLMEHRLKNPNGYVSSNWDLYMSLAYLGVSVILFIVITQAIRVQSRKAM